MTVEKFKALRVGQLVANNGCWTFKIIEKIGDTIICVSLDNLKKAAFSVHDAERLTLLTEEWPKRIKASIHSDQFSMLVNGERIGLTGEALQLFRSAFGELVFEIEVQDDGKFRILTVDGHEVKQ